MDKIIPATPTVLGDEKAWALYEVNLQSPGNHGFHRYQIIQVNRDGTICEWRKDMGSAKKFKGINQIRIPSLMEHSVNELKGIADSVRGRSSIDVKDFLSLEKYNPC